MTVCSYCYQALLSRGEKVFASSKDTSCFDEPISCDWCGEEDEDLTEVIWESEMKG